MPAGTKRQLSPALREKDESPDENPVVSELDIIRLACGFPSPSIRKATTRFVRQEQFRNFFSGNIHMQMLGFPGLLATYMIIHPFSNGTQVAWFFLTAMEFVVQFLLLIAFGNAEKRRRYSRRRIYGVYFLMAIWISVSVGLMPMIADQTAHGESQRLVLYFIFLLWVFFVTWWCAFFPIMSLVAVTIMMSLYLITSQNADIVGRIEWTIPCIYMLFVIFFWRQWRVFVDSTLLRDEIRRSRDNVSLALAEFEIAAEDWLFETDPDGRINTVPDRMREAAAPIIIIENQTRLSDLFEEATGASYNLMTSYRVRLPIRDLVVQLKPATDERYWKLRGRPFHDEDEGFRGYRFIATDFTETHALQISSAERERHDAIVRMTAIIAHDFNNYLATIVGSLDVLEIRDNLSPAGNAALQNARKGAMRAAQVTHDLLSFTNDHKPLAARQINCLKSIEDVSQDILSAHGLALIFKISVDADLHVLADPVTFQRALRNLMENAAKAMSFNGLIKVRAEKIDDGKIAISIRDHGPGIPDDMLDKVFEPFFTTRRSEGGTGLGLAMVKAFARKSEGHVKLENAHPGLKATLVLPAALALQDFAPEADETRHQPRSYNGRKALLLEDNKELEATMREILADLGFQVTSADSLDALKNRTRLDDRLDLIVSDVVLTDGHSFSAVEDIRRSREKPPAVIYVSGYSKVQPPEGTEILLKPFSMNDLSARIHAVLGSEA